jgi:hypothetical protein
MFHLRKVQVVGLHDNLKSKIQNLPKSNMILLLNYFMEDYDWQLWDYSTTWSITNWN